VIGAVSASAAAVVIGWGGQFLGVVPFPVVSNVIMLNSTFGNWIGGLLLFLVYARVSSMGLLWRDVMDPKDIGTPLSPSVGVILLVAGGLGGWIVGAFLLSAPMIVPVIGLFFLAIIIAAFLL
jgi:hypothetical protein